MNPLHPPSPTQSVASVVLDHSECAEVFQRHRIDFCCRGGESVEAAAKQRGVDLDLLLTELGDAIAERRSPERTGPQSLPTPALIEHIIARHHSYLRNALPFLRPLAAKVARVHGERDPRLRELDQAVEALTASLLPHLDEEERALFPTLLAQDASPADRARQLEAMTHEHLEVAGTLTRIRDITSDFTLPDWACNSYRTLFAELEAMEGDIFTHVHLENHVLAPRFGRAPSPSTLGPIATFPLLSEAERLRESAAWRETGLASRTLVRGADARVVLLALAAGGRLHEHETAHSVSVQVIEGRVGLQLPDRAVELGAGELLFLEGGVPHDLVAREASVVLLTISWHGAAG